MTREEALQNLNLQEEATPEAIEKAYQRLVRRYPPEFHPEKFRLIDDSYRQLTSLPAMIEKLLAPVIEGKKLEPGLLIFDPSPPDSCIEKALGEIRVIIMHETLWPSPSPVSSSKGRRLS
ncbi:MAG: J domain-containing protein [Deltaproteobacteria bacterium]|jgi:hypothetical protein|nr:J domain-containing protein [Deltaproteobacteria bacterium]